jgi:acyl transferase domain-containing protein/acyl carrier protein
MTDEEALRDWLRQRVADALGTTAAEVDPHQALAELGIDSVTATEIAAGASERSGEEVDVGLVFEHPTIAEIARFLTSGRPTPRATGSWGREGDSSLRARAGCAIIGMSCRVPGADSIEEYWQLLEGGVVATAEIPAARQQLYSSIAMNDLAGADLPARFGGFLRDVASFDAPFFRVPREEALRMDPQHRLLLQCTWEALEDAGLNPDLLRGTSVGVFVGISTNDHGHREMTSSRTLGPLSITGNAFSTAANRISYLFDFHGPSMSIDTACSSSLVATHLAKQALREGECQLAVVAGVNAMLDVRTTAALARAGALSSDGVCRPFDAEANGTVRGEGCVVIVLKRADDAVADDDPTYATIVGSAVNQDGRSNGLTSPNPRAQVDVIAAALADADIRPANVTYVETHGTGTILGDPIEASALADVVGREHRADRPCLIGSVKSQIGHLEAAAGIAGLAKVALMLERSAIPATQNYKAPNPNISFEDLGLRVAYEPTGWPTDAERVAGISSFGFGGTNAHVLLRGHEIEPRPETPRGPWPCLVPVSARDEKAAIELAERLTNLIELPGAPSLSDIAAASCRHRAHHPWRLAISATDTSEAVSRLRHRSRQPIRRIPKEQGQVAFVFSGHTPVITADFADLIAERHSSAVLRRCSELTSQHGGWSLLEILQRTDADEILAKPDVAQPALVCAQLALLAIWESWGCRPDLVLGHSIGELAAAYASGGLAFDETVRIAVARGRAMAEAEGTGGTLAVQASEDECRAWLEKSEGWAEIAVVNGLTSVVLAGDLGALRDVEQAARANHRGVTWVSSSIAGHSRGLDPVLPSFSTALGEVDAGPPLGTYYSSSRSAVQAAAFDAEYWLGNLRNCVQFLPSLSLLLEARPQVVIEIGIRPHLRGPLQEAIGERESGALVVSSARRAVSTLRQVADEVARLYEAGVSLKWDNVQPPTQPVRLPPYPWRRSELPLDDAPQGLARAGPSVQSDTLLGVSLDVAGDDLDCYERVVDASFVERFRGHEHEGQVVMPGAGYIELAVEAARLSGLSAPIELRNIEFRRLLVLEDGGLIQTRLTASESGLRMNVYSRSQGERRWVRNCSCTLRAGVSVVPSTSTHTDVETMCTEFLSHESFYSGLAEQGLSYGPEYQNVVDAWHGSRRAVGRLAVATPTPDTGCDPKAVDAALQLIYAASLPLEPGPPPVPVGIERLTFVTAPPASSKVIVWTSPGDGGQQADLVILDDDQTCMSASGIRVSRLDGSRSAPAHDVWLYEERWRESEVKVTTPAVDTGCVIVAHHGHPATGNLADALVAAGREHLILERGAGSHQPAADLGDRAGARRALELISEQANGPMQDIIYLAQLAASATVLAEELAELSNLISQLAFAAESSVRRLWILTFASQSVIDGDEVTSPASAGLWGFARVLPFELARTEVRCLDLLDGGPTDCAAVALDLSAPPDEAAIGYREGRRYVRRIVESDDQVLGLTRPSFPPGTVLISGGVGELGIATAGWLVANGVRELALLSRHSPSPLADAGVQALQHAGASVHLVQADVAKRDELRDALEATGIAGTITGIVHAAGVLKDEPILDLDPNSIRAVLDPKINGAANLLELADTNNLLWVVCYSSAAGALGSPGQASYCAANAALDSFAAWSRSQGLNTISVQWGPWATQSLAQSLGTVPWDSAPGPAALTHDLALGVLGGVLERRKRLFLVLPFDLANLAGYYPTTLGSSMFAELVSEQSDLVLGGHRPLDPIERPDLDTDYVPPRDEVEEQLAAAWRAALGFKTIGIFDGFFELGGDSVFFNQLIADACEQFGVELDAEAAFENPTIAGLALLIGEALEAKVDAMTDEEARRALDGFT